jgi:hypothetical protein
VYLITRIVIVLKTVKICTGDFHVVPFSSNEFHENPLRNVRTLLIGINDFILINSVVIDQFR